MQLTVKVVDTFSLNAGQVEQKDDECWILPPNVSLFDQLCEWLYQHPAPTTGYHHWALGIGVTALCLRWGTYLAVLLDEAKPVDPRTTDNHVSMISDEEMKRINIEASSNLARLLEKMHDDEFATYDLLLRAYEALPMLQRRVKRKRDTCDLIIGNILAASSLKHNDAPWYQERLQLVMAHPYRSLANVITVLAYRNGPIEDIHAGQTAAYSLHHRRVNLRQSRDLLRFSCEQMSDIINLSFWDPHWPQTLSWPKRLAGLPAIMFYPHDWSLTETSAIITLLKEWTS